MQQSVTTGRRAPRSGSEPTRSPSAELTRRASAKADWGKGRWAQLLIDPFLACVTATKTSGMGWGESLLRQDSPHYVPCAMCQPRGSLRGLAPSCTRRRVLSETVPTGGRGATPRWRSRQGRSPRSSRMAAECPAGRRRSGYYVHVIPTSPIALLSGK